MRKLPVTSMVVMAAALAMVSMGVGCANAPLKTEGSTSGIRAAEEAGAAGVPKASLHVQLAKEELALAQELQAKGEKEKAVSVLARAEADAALALALSHGDAEQVEAKAAVERVRQLQQENP